jgi:membrane dipeptidase
MIAGKMKIFDGHNDILSKIWESPQPQATGAFLEGGPGHLDLPRAIEGGMAGGLFAVYLPDPPSVPSDEERIILSEEGYEISPSPALDYDYAYRAALDMIALLESIEGESARRLEITRNWDQLQHCLKEGIFAAVLHMEGAEPIQPDLDNLAWFYDRGLRSLGVTWSRPNAFGYGVPFKYPSTPDTGPGLTAAGRELVQACNQLGIMIDLAHITEKGFWDVAELSSTPLVSSHSAAWALIPKARNLTDDQLKAIRDSNGLVGIIFSVNDLDGEKRPKDDGPIQAIIRHMVYIAELIGPDHLAFGSDFDGTRIPSDLGDASGLQKLVGLLQETGFSQHELEMICFKNWLRVLKDSWK